MAPIRRYLQISKHYFLEVRLHLEDPYSQSWLLNPRNDVLTRIIDTIKPLVIRQLRDDRERARGKSKKRKGIKDVAYGDDFEVSIFLTDPSTRHSLLIKQKAFKERDTKLKSNSGKLTAWLDSNERSIDLEEGDNSAPIRQESDEEDGPRLEHYPEAPKTAVEEIDISEDEGFQPPSSPAGGRSGLDKRAASMGEDDKKKMALNLTYDGFSMYGRVLCLVIKRRGPKYRQEGVRDVSKATDQGGKQMLESWVSTQAAQDQRLIDDD